LFYLNFFVLNNLLAAKLQNPQVVLGLAAIALLSVLGTSSLSAFRRWSYRAFYASHVVGRTALPVIVFFHVPLSVRLYAVQCIVVSLLNVAMRIWETEPLTATAEVIDGTNIISIKASYRRRLSTSPGQHVYLRRSYLEANPFTAASASDSSIRLLARILNGNTMRLQTAIIFDPLTPGKPVSLKLGLE